MAIGGSGKFDLPLVYAGYGITAKEENYDDYAGLDVKGKAVLLLRHEPQQSDPHSVFDGTGHSQYALFSPAKSRMPMNTAPPASFSTTTTPIS